MALNWLLNIATTLLLVDHSSPDGSRTISGVEKMSGGGNDENRDELKKAVNGGFQMPLHYPRYVKSDYEKMEEWRLDMLLRHYRQYGLSFEGSLDEKRNFAMGAFLWPDQY